MNSKLQPIKQILKSKPSKYFVGYLIYQTATLFLLFTGLLLKQIFAHYDNKSDNTVWVFIVGYIIMLLGRIIAVFIYSKKEVDTRFYTSTTLRGNILKDLFRKPGAETTNKTTGEILNSFKEDVEQIEEYIQSYYIEFASTAVFSIIAIIILARINYMMLLCSFSPLVVIILLVKRAGKGITKYRSLNRSSTGKVSATIGEIFTNIQAVKLSGSEETMIKYFKRVNKERSQYAIIDNLFSQFLSVIYSNVVNIGTGFVLIAVAIFFNNGQFDLSEFTIFIYYMSFISMSIEYFGTAFINQKRAIVALNNISGISIRIEIDSIGENAIEPTQECENQRCSKETKAEFKKLSIKNLGFTYSGSDNGITNINLDILPNSITVITGRIGSGKTTLVRTMIGLLKGDNGEIYWNNEIIDAQELLDSGKISYCPQVPHFFSATIKDNIELGKNHDNTNTISAIYDAALEEDIESFTHGMEETIGSNGVKTSGGQQKRISLARMLIRNSEVYIIDDISSSLDTKTSHLIWDRLFSKKNKTYIIVSNRREELKKASTVILLKNGRIEAQGSLETLLKDSDEMKLIWGND